MNVGLSDAVAFYCGSYKNSIANRGAVRLQPPFHTFSQILPINRGAVEFSAKRYEEPSSHPRPLFSHGKV